MTLPEEAFAKDDRALCALTSLALAAIWNTGPPRDPAYPDEVDRNSEAVDFAATLRETRCYFEHTLIESYRGQREDVVRLNKVFPGAVLPVSLPNSGQFCLSVPPNAGRLSRDPETERCAIAAWVEERAPTMSELSPSSVDPACFGVSIAGVPFPVSVMRWTSDPTYATPSGVRVLMGWSSEHEASRVERYAEALQNKCPKLTKSGGSGDRTVLVLEDIDWSLSGVHVVAKTLREAQSFLPMLTLPTEIVLVQDHGAVTLTFSLLRENGLWLDSTRRLPLTPEFVDVARPVLRRRYGA